MRLKDKVAIVVGAGQMPGDTVGNGRAAAILFAREGARVALIDCNRESALETQALIEAEGGTCFTFSADVTRAQDCEAFVRRRWRLTAGWIFCTTMSGSGPAMTEF